MEKKQARIEEKEEIIPFSFPDKIEEETLLRLPTKSLIQFKCVSKPWKTRITSSQFARKHLKHQSQANNKKLNLMVHGRDSPLQSVSCNSYDIDAKLIAHNQPLLPEFIDHEKHIFNILGSCDGLLLLVVTTFFKGDHSIYIWNPTTGEYKILPQLKEDDCYVYGFGRDLTTDNNDYKVLFLECTEGDSGLDTLEFKVKMYTTYTNSWKTLPNVPFMNSGGGDPEGMVLAYNNLNYLAEIYDPFQDNEFTVISFDLKDDKFREIPLPIAPGVWVNLCNLNGDLCAFTEVRDIKLHDVYKMENFGVKEQECWTKLFSIDIHVVMDQPIRFMSLLHLLDDGQILLNTHYRSFHQYNPFVVCYWTEEKKASFFVQDNVQFMSIPVVYEESLISPNAASTVEEELPKQLKRRRTHMREVTPSAPLLPVAVELESSSSCWHYV